MPTISTLTVDIDADTSRFDSATSKFGSGLKTVAKGAAVAGAALVGVGIAGVDAASDLNESQSKVGVVFGKSQDVINEWAESAATNLGLSQQAALEAAGTFGNLFTAMKFSKGASASMSRGLVDLSSDLASFNNIDPTQVLEDLRSGLLGEAEPLRKYGVQLSAARIEQEAQREGLEKVGGEFTSAAKAQAAYMLIMQDTRNAQGDFARTSDGVANGLRIVKASFQDALAEVGTSLLPTISKILPIVTKVITGLADTLGPVLAGIFETLGPIVMNVIKTLEPVVGVLGKALGSILKALAPLLAALLPPLAQLVKAFAPLLVIGVKLLVAVLKPMLPTLVQLITLVAKIVRSVVKWIKQNVDLTKVSKYLQGGLKLVIAVVANLIVWGMRLWNRLVSYWNLIKGATKALVSAVVNTFQSLKQKVGDVWRAIKEAAVNVWHGIGDVVRGVWDGIKDTVRSAANFVIGILNDIIGGINTVIGAINHLPGPDIGTISPIPTLQHGGIVEKTGLAIVHEGERYSGVGGGGWGQTVNVYVQGSVIAEHDLAETVQKVLLRSKKRSGALGLA